MLFLPADSLPHPVFVPLAGLPAWNALMRKAMHAWGRGLLPQALAGFERAWRFAGTPLVQRPDPVQVDCVQAWVCSGLCLSEVQAVLHEATADRAGLSTLVQTHQVLLDLIQSLAPRHALREAAVMCSRSTHEALVQHWQTHGPDPRIDAALRASCMRLCLPASRTATGMPRNVEASACAC